MKLWRIAAETRQYQADDLSGAGAARNPGRWNRPGEQVLYTAPTLSLAVLETAAHIDDAGLPLNRFVVEITLPPETWKRRRTLEPQDLDPAWRSIPAGIASIDAGSAWYKTGASVLLLVPSVIVEEEFCVLINTTHADAKGLSARIIRQFEFNRLFRG